jgi:RNA polymerase sigma-32 factor
MWWIKASIQEYILRSWSLVKMGTTANQKKLFFNLRKAKSKISALDEGDLRPDQVKHIAVKLGVPDACTRCHLDKNSRWSDETVTKWYGPGRRPHYGEILQAGRNRQPSANP